MKAALWFIADVEMCLFFLIGFSIVILTGIFHVEFGDRSWTTWQVGYSIMFLSAFNIGRMLFLCQEFHDLYQAQGQQLYARDFGRLLWCLGLATGLLMVSVVILVATFRRF